MKFTMVVPSLILISLILVIIYQFTFNVQGNGFPSTNLSFEKASCLDY